VWTVLRMPSTPGLSWPFDRSCTATDCLSFFVVRLPVRERAELRASARPSRAKKQQVADSQRPAGHGRMASCSDPKGLGLLPHRGGRMLRLRRRWSPVCNFVERWWAAPVGIACCNGTTPAACAPVFLIRQSTAVQRGRDRERKNRVLLISITNQRSAEMFRKPVVFRNTGTSKHHLTWFMLKLCNAAT